jgi:hypothetical protein
MLSLPFYKSSSPLFIFPWLFGFRSDLAVCIGGMMAGFALIGMHLFLGWNMILVWFVWVVTMDMPHFFASYSRTYFDRKARKEFQPLLWLSLLIFGLAPLVIMLSNTLHQAGVENFKAPWNFLIAVVGAWAYFHITRQHYGFLRLYNRKNGEIGTNEAKLDAGVLYGFLAFAFVGVLVYFNRTQRILGITPAIGEVLYIISLFAVIFFAVIFFLYQVGKIIRGEPINVPKVIFLSTIMLLHGVVSFGDVLPAEIMLALTATITIYHDIQYLFFVRFQGQKRYGNTVDSRRQFGFAGILSKNFVLFMVAALLMMSIPVWTFACIIGRVPVCSIGPQWGEATFLGETTWVLLFAAMSVGIQTHHYILDMYIWRPGKSARLRQELNL